MSIEQDLAVLKDWRIGHAEDHSEIARAIRDVAKNAERLDRDRGKQIDGLRNVLVGLLISLSTATVLLAINLVAFQN